MAEYWVKNGDAPNVWDDGLPPGGQACEACGQPTESEPCEDHQPYAFARQLLDVAGIVESVLSVRLDDEPLRFDVNWNKGFAKAVGLFEAALFKDAMDADRPAGDQPDSLRAMVTPREDAEAGTGQKHRPEGSIASLERGALATLGSASPRPAKLDGSDGDGPSGVVPTETIPLGEGLRPLLTWAETCSQHYGMLRQEPPFTTTKKLRGALAAAYAAIGQVRASASARTSDEA